MLFYSEGLWRVVGKAASRRDRPSGSNAVLSLHALRCSTCIEIHRVVSSRIESSLFSVRSASHFTVLSCRLFQVHLHSTLRIADLCAPINTPKFVNSQQHSNTKAHCLEVGPAGRITTVLAKEKGEERETP